MSEVTALNRVNIDGTFDAYGLSRDACIMPHSINGDANMATDKGHLDILTLDRDRMEEIYNTRDFNAAIGKCHKNNQFGPDGGDQGYNPYLNEMYNNGCLKYSGTYEAEQFSKIKCQKDYDDMKDNAFNKTKLYIEQRDNPVPNKKYDELIKAQGFDIDPKSYEDTKFKVSRTFNNSDELNNYYKNYQPKDNVSIETKPSDRVLNGASIDNQLTSKPQEEIKIPQKSHDLFLKPTESNLRIPEKNNDLTPAPLNQVEDVNHSKLKDTKDSTEDSISKIKGKKGGLDAA